MENISISQEKIKQKRQAFAQAEQAYYNALQAWSLNQGGVAVDNSPAPTPAEVGTLQTSSQQARQALKAEIEAMHQDTTAGQLMEQVPASLPFLLLPLRVEARYLTVRHVVRHLKIEDTVDASTINRLAGRLRTLGFEKDEEGVMTYQVQALHLVGGAGNAGGGHHFDEFKPLSGNFIRRKNDKRELRIRMYPDDIFIEGFERALQVEERNAGQQYWQQVGLGREPREAWRQLAAASTPARAAWMVRATRPTNFVTGQAPPATPEFAPGALKDGAYTYPPVTRLLPDRLVVRLYKNGVFQDFTGKVIPEPLVLGLDPTHDPFDTDPSSGLAEAGTGLKSPEYLRWIHHFEAAETAGLAVRIDLDLHPEYQTGVDKIVVVGAKLAADGTEGSRLWQDQLENHLYKEEGLGIIAKGTPTNNYEQQKTGYNQREQEADRYFQSEWLAGEVGNLNSDEFLLNKALGLGTDFHLPGGQGTDISEAALMNELLWPATWGYYLMQFFSPALDESTREQLRLFFLRHVHGRGGVPVLRVNRQPYGILPVSSWTHWQYGPGILSPEEQLAASLWTLFLSKLISPWKMMANQIQTVNTVGGQGRGLDDRFIQMLGVSPSSAQLQRGWVAGLGFQEVMRAAQIDPGEDTELRGDPSFQPAAFARELAQMGLPAEHFQAVTGAYNTGRQKVRRIFLDGLPVADNRPLELLAGKDWNYLQWLEQAPLLDIWSSNFDTAPSGGGAADSSAAVSVLAVLTRQAVLRAYLESGMRVAEPQPGLWLLKVKDFEAQHLHLNTLSIDPAALSPENTLHQAYKPFITQFGITNPFDLEPDRRAYFTRTYGSTGALTLSDWLKLNKKNPELSLLPGIMDALHYFSQTSTGKLERLFTEHLDLCSHRLDAWLEGLVSQRLHKQREAVANGLGLGAFGFLLDLQPNARENVVFVEEMPEYLPAKPQNVDLAAIPVIHSVGAREQGIDPAGAGWDRAFFYIGNLSNPRVRLNTITNQVEPDDLINLAVSDGFIHAPSSAHATAAAILRTGFLNHQSDNKSALLAIQLNSPRVRQALQLLEGMQQGASLGELLGFYLERMLHENKLDSFLYNMRAAFPLPRTETAGSSPSPLTALDGLSILGRRRQDPTGWLKHVPGINPSDANTQNRINNLALELEGYLDSLGDLLLAESVYQSAKGNTDRAAAALRILNSGGQVVLPEWVRTNQKGRALTHRVGVVFKQEEGVRAMGWTAGGSPRATLSPDLNTWLQSLLPPPTAVVITVQLPDGRSEVLTLAELDLEPLDLLYALPSSLAGAEASPFGLYVLRAAQKKFVADLPAGSMILRMDFKDRSALAEEVISIFELSSIVSALRKTVKESRPLSANDFLLPDQQAATANCTDTSRLKTALQQYLATNTGANLILKLRDQAAALAIALEQGLPAASLDSILRGLQASLLTAWQLGIDISEGAEATTGNLASLDRLAKKAVVVATELENRWTKAQQQLSALDPSLAGEALYKGLQDAANLLFGATLPLFPDVRLSNQAEIQACYQGWDKIENAGSAALDTWMQEASLVRPHLRVFRQTVLLSELLAPASSRSFGVLQFPFFEGRKQPWIGGMLPADLPAEQTASVSLLLELPIVFAPDTLFSGLVVDEWPELIPEKTIDTGVAFQYNQPNTEPPQTMLLAVAPVEAGNWQWEHLVGAVNDALELSKMRLVTPEHLHDTFPSLNQVLPAILLPFMAENQHSPVVDPL